jgi:hypothetical protein
MSAAICTAESPPLAPQGAGADEGETAWECVSLDAVLAAEEACTYQDEDDDADAAQTPATVRAALDVYDYEVAALRLTGRRYIAARRTMAAINRRDEAAEAASKREEAAPPRRRLLTKQQWAKRLERRAQQKAVDRRFAAGLSRVVLAVVARQREQVERQQLLRAVRDEYRTLEGANKRMGSEQFPDLIRPLTPDEHHALRRTLRLGLPHNSQLAQRRLVPFGVWPTNAPWPDTVRPREVLGWLSTQQVAARWAICPEAARKRLEQASIEGASDGNALYFPLSAVQGWEAASLWQHLTRDDDDEGKMTAKARTAWAAWRAHHQQGYGWRGRKRTPGGVALECARQFASFRWFAGRRVVADAADVSTTAVCPADSVPRFQEAA